jgi:phthiocerol/phenolphthiocerol synthesis type-I polyketide synthase E
VTTSKEVREVKEVKEVSAIADDVIEFWREALGLDEIGPDDDFFELGGNSVAAIRLLPLLDERFAVKADVLLIFDYPTPRELATRLVALGSARED